MQQRGVRVVYHYIDDFITMGAPKSLECRNNVVVMKDTCMETGTPVEPEKDEGPATEIEFLGMELDSTNLS